MIKYDMVTMVLMIVITNCLSTVSASSPLHVVDNRSPQPGSMAHLADDNAVGGKQKQPVWR